MNALNAKAQVMAEDCGQDRTRFVEELRKMQTVNWNTTPIDNTMMTSVSGSGGEAHPYFEMYEE